MKLGGEYDITQVINRIRDHNDRVRSIANGYGECTIHGAYQRQYLSPAETAELDGLLLRSVARRAIVDVENLQQFGVDVTDERGESIFSVEHLICHYKELYFKKEESE